jgi:hypothetical protein
MLPDTRRWFAPDRLLAHTEVWFKEALTAAGDVIVR